MNFKVSAKLLLFSKSQETGKEIATFVVTIPKFIQAHINSHRALSRNASSSRAIPSHKLRERVLKNPFIPIEFAKNQPGMRGGEKVSGFKLFVAQKTWLWARYIPCFFHWIGEKLNIHKEVLNRMIEPWMYTEVIITATEWGNFIKLRSDNAAQPEIQIIAKDIKRLLSSKSPQRLNKRNGIYLLFLTAKKRARY
jgi:hypothetical protein